jgi:hypothetical protein
MKSKNKEDIMFKFFKKKESPNETKEKEKIRREQQEWLELYMKSIEKIETGNQLRALIDDILARMKSGHGKVPREITKALRKKMKNLTKRFNRGEKEAGITFPFPLRNLKKGLELEEGFEWPELEGPKGPKG